MRELVVGAFLTAALASPALQQPVPPSPSTRPPASAAPASGLGTVIVEVRPARSVGMPATFTFDSNLADGEAGSFSMTTSGAATSRSFDRPASDRPYQIAPRLPGGWSLSYLRCGANRSDGRRPASGWSLSGTTASIRLAAGDAVGCVYAVQPPAGGSLTIRTVSTGGSGTFGYTVAGPSGTRAISATTRNDATAVTTDGEPLAGLAAGSYTINLSMPTADAGAWSLAAVACNGSPIAPAQLTVRVAVAAGGSYDCVFRAARKPGAVRLRLVTNGGAGTGAFSVDGEPAPAEPGAEVRRELPLGDHVVLPAAPPSTVDSTWRLAGFDCQPGEFHEATDGGYTVTLTSNVPEAVCTATYELAPATTATGAAPVARPRRTGSAFGLLPAALIGAGMMGVGAMLLLFVFARRRTD